jgi:hypothetical protein
LLRLLNPAGVPGAWSPDWVLKVLLLLSLVEGPAHDSANLSMMDTSPNTSASLGESNPELGSSMTLIITC